MAPDDSRTFVVKGVTGFWKSTTLGLTKYQNTDMVSSVASTAQNLVPKRIGQLAEVVATVGKIVAAGAVAAAPVKVEPLQRFVVAVPTRPRPRRRCGCRSTRRIRRTTSSERADGTPGADPRLAFSRSRLNVARALYIFDDYLRYHDATGVHEVLGVQQGMTGTSCDGAVDAHTLWAAKRGNDGLWIYRGRTLPTHLVEAPCLATVTATAAMQFHVRAQLDAQGQVVPSPGHPVVRLPLGQVEQFAGASRPYRAPL